MLVKCVQRGSPSFKKMAQCHWTGDFLAIMHSYEFLELNEGRSVSIVSLVKLKYFLICEVLVFYSYLIPPIYDRYFICI